jgi:UDP-GlcNAc:polypeptide alpha-N-acetylglucosaminyltransferase
MITEINNSKRSLDKRVILSHYPGNYDDIHMENEGNNVARICKSFFNDRGMISYNGAVEMAIDKNEYIQVPYMTGGFFFTYSNFLQDVPFDPHLDFLFVGEEISHTIRAWTSGYDIYTPTENIVYHFYTRGDDPKIWDDKTYSDNDAMNKVKKLLKLDENVHVPEYIKMNIEKYGLGTIRSLEEYYRFAGISVKDKTSSHDYCSTEYPDYKYDDDNVVVDSKKPSFMWEFMWKFLMLNIVLIFFVSLLYIIAGTKRTRRSMISV